jgi:hypothetical protein
MSQKSVTTSKLDKLNSSYQQLLEEKTGIQNQIDRIRRDINLKEQEIVSFHQKMIRDRSGEDDVDEQKSKLSTIPQKNAKNFVKDTNEQIEQLQAEMKTLIQKSKFVGKKIDDLEMEMLDLATKSEANRKE